LIGGTLLADGFGQEASMDGRPVKGWTTVALGIGMIVVLVFNGSPVELLRIAQGLAVVAFPVLGFLVLSLARDRALMGQYANATWVHGIAVMGYVALLGIALNYARQILGIL
jgi:Mn2+/Fe2+ NRAMP family transporter